MGRFLGEGICLSFCPRTKIFVFLVTPSDSAGLRKRIFADHITIEMLIRHILASICITISYVAVTYASPGKPGCGGDCGLVFHSHEINPDARTSLSLTGSRPIRVKGNGIVLSFDMKIKQNANAFGTVCRISDKNSGYLELISNHNGSILYMIYAGASGVLSNTPIGVAYGEYNHVRISLTKEEIRCRIGADSVSVPLRTSPFEKLDINFGCSYGTEYFNTDLPPFTLKNVRIYNMDGALRFRWPLDRHAGNVAYDTERSRKAIALNPEWEIDRHTDWAGIFSVSIPEANPQIAYDSDKCRIFIAYDDTVKVLHLADGKTEALRVGRGEPFYTVGNSLIYDSKGDRLVSYNAVSGQIRSFSFGTCCWDGAGQDSTVLERQHHTKYFDKRNNILYIFGGYGHYRYHNDLHTVDLDTGNWTSSSFDKIAPRYLSALGTSGGELYLAGGFGSDSGKQEENPQNYYDIYRIDPDSMDCAYCTEIEFPEEKYYVFGKSLIPGETAGKVYAIVYSKSIFNTEARLVSMDLSSGKVSEYASPIGFRFHDIRSYADLILSETTGAAYCILAAPGAGGNTDIDIYGIDFPPYAKGDIVDIPHYKRNILWAAAAAGILAALSGAIAAICRKKKGSGPEERGKDGDTVVRLRPENVRNAYIRMLGGFSITDKNGEDITKSFSPMLRNIFVFLILKNGEGGKGLPLQTLDETFWPDLEHSDAINNRRVNLSKLRSILKNADGIHIRNESGIICLDGTDGDNCDYIALRQALADFKRASHDLPWKDRMNMVSPLVSMAAAGPLLPEINADWIEEFRNSLFWQFSEILSGTLCTSDSSEALKMQIQTANILLSYDPIDEDAIKIKCRALYRLGQKGLSKQTFDTFAASYKALMDSEPEISFKDAVK